MVNAYKINFNDESNKFDCELLTYEQTITPNYLYVLDNYKIYVDQRMEQIFSENNAQTIPEGTRKISFYHRLETLFFVSVARLIYFLWGRGVGKSGLGTNFNQKY